jgi:hypothetical protein
MAEASRLSAAERSRRYRERKRAQGLRLVSAWIPDLRDPAVRKRIEEQLLALRGHPDEIEALRFVEGATADMDWDA